MIANFADQEPIVVPKPPQLMLGDASECAGMSVEAHVSWGCG
ncbi:hypothetical protein [Nocardia tengchongensis]